MIRIIKFGNLIYENIEPKIIDENGNEIWNIPNDLTQLKNAYIDTVDWLTERYIEDKFKSLNENLADIISEEGVIEYKFYTNNIDPHQVKLEVFNIIKGVKTISDVITELSIPQELQPLLERAIEIAKLIDWKERIWLEELNIENKINSITSIDELLAMDLKEEIKIYDTIQV